MTPENLINDLERRFKLLMEMDDEDITRSSFNLAVHDYVDVLHNALSQSPSWHKYSHQMIEEWETAVTKIEGVTHREFTAEETSILRARGHYYLASAYYDLEAIYEYIEGGKIGREHSDNDFRKMNNIQWRAKESLQRLHPTIIAKISEDIGSKNSEPKTNALLGIHYNPLTGVGWANGKKFKFKDNQPDFKVFGRLYEQMGQPFLQKDIFALTGRTAGGTSNYFVNELAKKIRERTGLSTHELVLNNGNLTLATLKLEEFPK